MGLVNFILGPNIFWDLLRSLLGFIDQMVFALVAVVTQLIVYMANVTILTGVFDAITERIYVLIAVVALFVIGVALLKGIVNPDGFGTGGSEGGLLKNIIFSFVLLVFFPTIMDRLYELQGHLMLFIPDLILGNKNDTQTTMGSIGEQLAGTTFKFFVHPNKNCGEGEEERAAAKTPGEVAGIINTRCSDSRTYKYDYWFGFSAIVGLVMAFLLFTHIIDIALRSIRLSILQLIAPIAIIGRIDPRKSGGFGRIFDDWLSEFIWQYTDLFVRIASMYLMLFVIQNIIADPANWIKVNMNAVRPERTVNEVEIIPNTKIETNGITRLGTSNSTNYSVKLENGVYQIDGTVDYEVVRLDDASPDNLGELLQDAFYMYWVLIFLIIALLIFGRDMPKYARDILGFKKRSNVGLKSITGAIKTGFATATGGIGAGWDEMQKQKGEIKGEMLRGTNPKVKSLQESLAKGTSGGPGGTNGPAAQGGAPGGGGGGMLPPRKDVNFDKSNELEGQLSMDDYGAGGKLKNPLSGTPIGNSGVGSLVGAMPKKQLDQVSKTIGQLGNVELPGGIKLKSVAGTAANIVVPGSGLAVDAAFTTADMYNATLNSETNGSQPASGGGGNVSNPQRGMDAPTSQPEAIPTAANMDVGEQTSFLSQNSEMTSTAANVVTDLAGKAV